MTEYEIKRQALLERFPPMHEALWFDTHLFYRRLLTVDFNEKQADAMLSARVLIYGVEVDTRQCFERLREADLTEQQTKAVFETWMAYRIACLAAWEESRRP